MCSRTNSDHKIAISKHLTNANGHAEKELVRLVLVSFEVVRPHRKHVCLVYQPLGMSFTEFQNLLPDNKLPKIFVQRSTQLTLVSLTFLHGNNVVHTGKSTNKFKI